MKYLLLLCLTVSFYFGAKAQANEIVSILYDETSIENDFDRMLLDEVIGSLNKSNKLDFQVFSFDEAKETVNWKGEGPIGFSKKLLFLKSEKEFYESVEFKKDDKGKLTGATLYPAMNVVYKFKYFDLASSQLITVDAHKYEHNKSTFSLDYKSIEIDIKKYKKIQGKNRETLIRKEILKDNAAKLTKHYESLIERDIKIPLRMGWSVVSDSDSRMFKVSPMKAGMKGGKFMIDAGTKDDIGWLSDFRVIKKINIAGYEIGEYVGRGIATESYDNETKCGFIGGGSKRLKAAFEAGEEVYAVRNASLINKINQVKEKEIRVAIQKSTLFSNSEVQHALNNIENVILLERGHQFILDYFLETYKGEQYIDEDLEAVLGDQEGVDFYIEFTNTRKILATNVKTGVVKSVVGGAAKDVYRQFFLELFDKEIKFLELSKEKKEKAKKAIIYSPFGFDKGNHLIVSKLIEEKVGSKTILRKEKIGSAFIKRKYSDQVVEVNIMECEKELWKLLQTDQKIAFDYKVSKK